MGLRGHLKLLVYQALQEKPQSGYALMNMIGDTTGTRPSAGSIYPLLESMAEDGTLEFEEKTNKKIYSLTDKGKKQTKQLLQDRDQILREIKERVKMLSMMQESDYSHYLDTIDQQLKGKVPFGTLNDDMEELREHLYKLNALGLVEKKTAQIRKILKRTNNDLKKLL